MSAMSILDKLFRSFRSEKGDPAADLIRAIDMTDAKGVRRAIKRGADPNGKGRDGVLPLLSIPAMIASPDNVEIARLLVDHGADVNAADRYGETPLMVASKEAFSEMVALLIARGAEIARTDKFHRTAEDRAREHGHDAIVRTLRAHEQM